MSETARKRATYQDVLDAPEDRIAEVLDGELVLSPRPRMSHQSVVGELFATLGDFHRRGAAPGGWLVLVEAELHLGDEVLVPDLAAWRRSRLPSVPDEVFANLAPDWVAEVLSPTTARRDRGVKLRIYAAAGVERVWLVDPEARTLEVLRREGPHWLRLGGFSEGDVVRLEPFGDLELDVASLFRDLP